MTATGHETGDPTPDLIELTRAVLAVVGCLAAHHYQMPEHWTMRQVLAVEALGRAADTLADVLGDDDRDRRSLYLGVPPGDDEPRCGAPTRTTSGPCRSPVETPGDRCGSHAGAARTLRAVPLD